MSVPVPVASATLFLVGLPAPRIPSRVHCFLDKFDRGNSDRVSLHILAPPCRPGWRLEGGCGSAHPDPWCQRAPSSASYRVQCVTRGRSSLANPRKNATMQPGRLTTPTAHGAICAHRDSGRPNSGGILDTCTCVLPIRTTAPDSRIWAPTRG